MRKMLFSKEKNGFYDTSIHSQIPADAFAIEEEVYLFLLEEQANGKEIKGDENGHPVAVERVNAQSEPTINDLKRYLKNTDYQMLPDYMETKTPEENEKNKQQRTFWRNLIRTYENPPPVET